jgi:SAM-dependent methyltransferase
MIAFIRAKLRNMIARRERIKKILSLDPSVYDVGLSNSTARDAWIRGALHRIPKGHRLLDVGAGTCQYKSDCKHLTYVSQDFCRYDGAGDDRGLHTGQWDTTTIDIVSDICAIPAPTDSFDVILCTEVFEHIPNPVAALFEFNRLLKSGGVLILTAPFCSLTHFSPFHFSTGFNRYFYEHHLSQLDFEVIELVENGNYFDFLGQEIRRLEHVADRYSEANGPTKTERYAVQAVLAMLERMAVVDTGSQELLTFGYHLQAIKK